LFFCHILLPEDLLTNSNKNIKECLRRASIEDGDRQCKWGTGKKKYQYTSNIF